MIVIGHAEPSTVMGSSTEFFKCNVYLDDELGCTVSFVGPPVLEEQLGIDVYLLVRRWAVEHLRSLAASGDLPGPGLHRVELDDSQFESLRAMSSVKECRHRAGEQPEHFCNAVALAAGSAITVSDCTSCDVPDTRDRCMWSAHTSISVSTAGANGDIYRMPAKARCGQNEPSATRELPSKCKIGGHECWQVDITPRATSVVLSRSPQDVAVALDLMAAEWRLAYGKKKRLYQTTSAQASIGFGASDVRDRETFVTSLQELVLVVESLKVPLVDYPEPASYAKDNWEKLRDLQRMEELLADLGLSDAAIEAGRLRGVIQLNNTLKHDRKELRTAFGQFGIAYPISDWHSCWVTVLSRVHDSLLTIARDLSKKDS